MKRKDILIVEDEILIAEDLRMTLLDSGYNVCGTFSNSNSTLKFLETHKPDLIIMDIQLEGQINGIQLTKLIHEKYDIPVVYCSAYGDMENVENAAMTDAFGYIIKPIEERELRAVLKIAFYKQKMEFALKKSEQRWKFALEGNGDAVWEWNREGNMFFLSLHWRKYFELNTEKLVWEDWEKCIHPNDKKNVRSALEDVMNNKREILTLEHRMILPEGKVVWVLTRGKVMEYSVAGESLRIIGTISDISKRKQIEQNIIESEKKYRNLVENLSEGIAIVDSDENFIFANKAACNIFETSLPLLLTKNLKNYTESTEYTKIINETNQRKKGKIGDYELAIITDNNSRKILRIHTTAMFDHGKYIGSFGIINDITEKKKYEEEMLNQERLESLGILAGGIAHDFNNILTAILSNIEYAKMNVDDKEKLQRVLDDAASASLQAKHLTNQLLTFSKGGAPKVTLIDLKKLITQNVDFVLRGSKILAKLDIQPDLLPIFADEGQITQVFQNLIINSMQAIPKKGEISISARNVEHDGLSKKIEIIISDNGKGIPAEVLDKIFNPFFTTKQTGTGLGLSTTYSIIQKHQGTIHISSIVNKGTTVKITLPAAEENSLLERSKINRGCSSANKNLRILVLDDNEMIRDVTKEMLEQLGHKVDGFFDGDDAIQAYRKNLDQGIPYDIMFLDLTIPNSLGGEEVLAEIHSFDETAKAIVTSGYSNNDIISNYKDYGFMGILKKPYQLEDIQDILADL